jgi:hypothetical protein
MTELRKVSGPGSGFDRHVGRIIAVVVGAILIAIVKPWGSPAAPAAVVPPPPPPTASPTARPSSGPDVFDYLTFGTNEPPPGWEIWPAGNLASFHFAMRVDLSAPGDESATPVPIATPTGSPGLGAVPSSWPTIRIPVGSFLDLIGLNSPIGYTVPSVTLRRLDVVTSVPTLAVIGRSPWPDHFTIVGFAAAGGGGSMQAWPAGHYRLDVVIEPGHLTRTVEVVIDAAAPSPSPSTASAAPGS